jgi:hypothetical protein
MSCRRWLRPRGSRASLMKCTLLENADTLVNKAQQQEEEGGGGRGGGGGGTEVEEEQKQKQEEEERLYTLAGYVTWEWQLHDSYMAGTSCVKAPDAVCTRLRATFVEGGGG